MGNPRLDENEIPGGVLHDFGQTFAILVADVSLENVQHHLKADMDVGIGHAARRNGRHVHGKLAGRDVLFGEPRLVMNAVPVAAVPAAPDNEDAGLAFCLGDGHSGDNDR